MAPQSRSGRGDRMMTRALRAAWTCAIAASLTTAAPTEKGPTPLAAPVETAAVAAPKPIQLIQTQTAETALPSWPFITAVPLPEGALRDGRRARLYDEAGEPVAAYFEPLTFWTSECMSVKWLRVAFVAPVEAGKQATYTLQYGSVEPEAPAATLKVVEDDDGVTVDTGAIQFVVPKRGGGFLSSVRRGSKAVYAPADNDGPCVVDQTGAVFRARLDAQPEVAVEESNPVRVVVRAESWCLRDRKSGSRGDSPAGSRLTKCILRYYAYVGEPWIELHWTFVVTADTETTALREISLRMTGDGRGVLGLTEGQTEEAEAEAYVLQKKARLYKLFEKKASAWVEVPGLKAPPPQWTETSRGRWAPGWAANDSFSLSMRDFAALFPKELYVRSERGWDGRLRSEIALHAWPAHGEFNDDWFAEPATAPAANVPHEKIKGANGAPLNAIYFQNSQKWHHGPLLDFNYPDWWRGENIAGGPKAAGWLDVFAGGTSRAWAADALFGRSLGAGPGKLHAAGTSRTQEMILDFSANKADDTHGAVATRRKLFAEPPHVWLRNPAWVVETKALAPLDATMLLNADDASRETWRRIADSEHGGMWTWGSLPERWLADGTPGLSGLYGGNGLRPDGRTAWHLYARTGNAAHLRAARASTAQWRDVHLVHYFAPGYAGLSTGARKLLGAATSSSAYPWMGGDAGVSQGDLLAWDYCIRGDLRSLEALRLHALFLMSNTLTASEDERAAQIRTLQEWYAMTWELPVAARIRELSAPPAAKPAQ